MITLTSDFGSPYPAAMRGVVCSRSDARLVDVTHDLPRQDVRAGAFWCRELLPYFPPSVHLVVIDPGVGTDRNALVIEAGDHVFVCPDNGVCWPVATRLAPTADRTVYRIDEDRLEPVAPAGRPGEPRSNTFHGRDVFAPAGAAVHEADNLGALPVLEPVSEWTTYTLPEPTLADGRAVGEVLVVDGFGNLITNVPGAVISEWENAVVGGESIPVVETFGSVPVGDRLATVGSHGNVELDVNQGRGEEAFGLTVGDEVVLERD